MRKNLYSGQQRSSDFKSFSTSLRRDFAVVTAKVGDIESTNTPSRKELNTSRTTHAKVRESSVVIWVRHVMSFL